ncbi:MAG: guanylate kinase [Clostridia bacterium]|nr:guanylate kinase [Clostridia bacterium]
MNIIYIMGKSSSGKDTIFNIIKNKLKVNTYIMYTTRPIREGEVPGETYNYISDKEMQEYVEGKNKNKLIESRTYQTIHGPWTYATIADEQFNTQEDLIMLGTLESYNKVKEYFKDKVIPIYIEVEDGIRLERALKREKEQKEPKYTELCRRFLADSKDFSEENIKNAGIEKRFQNIELHRCIDEIIEYVNKQEK